MDFNAIWEAIKQFFLTVWNFIVEWKEFFIVGFSLLVVLIVFLIINGSVKKKRKAALAAPVDTRAEKVMPSPYALFGFDPYATADTVEGEGEFYAVATSVASYESGLEEKRAELEKIKQTKNAVSREKADFDNKKQGTTDIISALETELKSESEKKGKKNKARIEDIRSEIDNNRVLLAEYVSDEDFCDRKISYCDAAALHVAGQINVLETSLVKKRELLASMSNDGGKAYETVKMYERGITVTKKCPAIVAPIEALIIRKEDFDKLKQKTEDASVTEAGLKSDVNQLYDNLATGAMTSTSVSKGITQKNKEIEQNANALTEYKQDLESVEREIADLNGKISAAAASYSLSDEDVTYAKDSLLAKRKYDLTGQRLTADKSKLQAQLEALTAEYDLASDAFAKIGKKNADKREEAGRRVFELSEQKAKVKKELEGLLEYERNYPTLSPAAFYVSTFTPKPAEQSDREKKRYSYREEIEQIKREYLEAVRDSLEKPDKERAREKQRELLRRLEETERKIYAEKTFLRTRAITAQYESNASFSQRKERILRELEFYKNDLQAIDSKFAADEYRAKLLRFANTLSEEDLRDGDISSTIRYCVERARTNGENAQATWNKRTY